MKLDDPHLESLLNAYRDDTQPSEALRAAMATRWRAAVRRQRRRSLVVIAGAVVAVAAILIVWLGGRWSTGTTVGAAPRASEAASVVVTARDGHELDAGAPAPASAPMIPAELPVAIPSSPVGAAVERPSASPHTPAAQARESQGYDDGVRLIAQAEAALAEGDPSRALALLEEHARRHPDASTREERRALQVLGLCGAGRRAEGRGARWSFLRDFPRSAYRARVEAACDG